MPIDVVARWPSIATPTSSGRLRVTIDDFVVRERRARNFDGEGEHLFVLVERASATTEQIQRYLARLFGVPRLDVGYAGMKDKWAVATQWFSVRQPKRSDAVPADRSVRILERHWHSKKLKVGDLDGNSFEIVVRGAGEVDETAIEQGFPNYFGPQRFGNDGANIDAAREWIEARETRARRRRIPAFRRSIFLSSLRALIFNDVLAARIASGQWRDPVDGDVCIDGLPSGPLWGRGRSPVTGTARAIEESVIAEHSTIAHGLEFAGAKQGRRPLVAKAEEVAVERGQDCVRLSFSLPKGSYATTFVSELVRIV